MRWSQRWGAVVLLSSPLLAIAAVTVGQVVCPSARVVCVVVDTGIRDANASTFKGVAGAVDTGAGDANAFSGQGAAVAVDTGPGDANASSTGVPVAVDTGPGDANASASTAPAVAVDDPRGSGAASASSGVRRCSGDTVAAATPLTCNRV